MTRRSDPAHADAGAFLSWRCDRTAVTSREWRGDRRAVFERDEYACRNCGAVGGDDDPTTVRTHPIGDVPLEGTVHETSLVTVCTDCFRTLQASETRSGLSLDRNGLFQLVRGTSRTQGATISDVASFASFATSLPTTLDDADEAADEGPEPPDRGSEPAAEYLERRLDVLLAIDIVDTRLDRLGAVETGDFPSETASLLETVSETATILQSDLREAVTLSETVVGGLDRCHGCFEPLESNSNAGSPTGTGSCETCGLEPRPAADWRRSDGTIAFDRLFSAINETLRGTATTTETLTEQTMALAEALLED